MKKFTSLLALLLALTMCMSIFVACTDNKAPGGNDAESTTDGTPETDPDETTASNKVKVYWYEGTKELRVDEVEKGTKIESWTPTSEAGEFDGWYAEASKETPFDFENTVINEDTDIFAKFKSNAFEVDPNEYYLIGTGSGDMGKAAWDHAKAAANLMMTKEENDKANIYTITITMYAGDMFQICYGGAWDGQQGIGFMKGAEYCDGVNFYDNNEYTAADKKVAQVKDAEGNVVFIGSDEYNKGFESWNIKLAEGMDGIYKFTFNTNPAAKEYNELTWELVEKIEPMAVTHDMHLLGGFNEWNTGDTNAAYQMKAADDGSSWSAIITVDAAVELKVHNRIGDAWYTVAEGHAFRSASSDNIAIPGAGTYAIKYTVEGNVVDIQACDYYVVGTFVDAEGKAVNFSIKNGVTPKLENGTVTFTATDVTALGDFSWIKDQGKPGVMAVKVVFGCELGIKDWFSDDANNGDNFYLTAGEHTVTLTIDAEGKGTVSIS